MIDSFLNLATDVQMLKTAFGGALKIGRVSHVDGKKGYRLELGKQADGSPYLSPWYPHPESGGQTSTWMPLSVGQVVGVINPSGDPRQGVLLRGGFSGENPQPSENLAENKVVFGALEVAVDGDALKIKFGQSQIVLTEGYLSLIAPKVHIKKAES